MMNEQPPCDDTEIMRLWRECGLPEYFLGNGGTNHKLLDFANRASKGDRLHHIQELCEALKVLADASDDIGVKYFDTDTMDHLVSSMQRATANARELLRRNRSLQ